MDDLETNIKDEKLLFQQSQLCTKQELRHKKTLKHIVLISIAGLVIIAVLLYWRNIKNYHKLKNIQWCLLSDVLSKADQLSKKLKQEWQVRNAKDILTHPEAMKWLSYLESQIPLQTEFTQLCKSYIQSNIKGFYALFDFDGNLYIFGKNKELSTLYRNNIIANTETKFDNNIDTNHGLVDIDNTPILTQSIKKAKMGGGFVNFKWIDDENVIGYVTLVPEYSLVLAGFIPLS